MKLIFTNAGSDERANFHVKIDATTTVLFKIALLLGRRARAQRVAASEGQT